MSAQDQEKTFSVSDRQQEISKKKKPVESTLDAFDGTEHAIKPTDKEEASLVVETARQLAEKLAGDKPDRTPRHMWSKTEEEELKVWALSQKFKRMKPIEIAPIISELFKGISNKALENKLYALRRAHKDVKIEASEPSITEIKKETKEPWEKDEPAKTYFSASEVPNPTTVILKGATFFAGIIGDITADIEITGDFKVRIIKQY